MVQSREYIKLKVQLLIGNLPQKIKDLKRIGLEKTREGMGEKFHLNKIMDSKYEHLNIYKNVTN